MQDKPLRFVCNNCAATKVGEKCTDCVGKGCNCPCQGEGKPDSEPTCDWMSDGSCLNPATHRYRNRRMFCDHHADVIRDGGEAVERVQTEPAKCKTCNDTGLQRDVVAEGGSWSCPDCRKGEPVPTTSVEPQVEPSRKPNCWTCIYCGFHYFNEEIELAKVVCKCGRGMGRWKVDYAEPSAESRPLS